MIFQKQYITLCQYVSSRANGFTKVAEDPLISQIYTQRPQQKSKFLSVVFRSITTRRPLTPRHSGLPSPDTSLSRTMLRRLNHPAREHVPLPLMLRYSGSLPIIAG